MSLSVEDILLGRRSPLGCTEEVWRRRQEEQKKKKAEEVANKIDELMSSTETKVNILVEKLREARRLEAEIKSQLREIGHPFLYAKDGLNGEKINIAQIAPLICVMGENLEDFGFDENVQTSVPEDFIPNP